MDHRQWAGGVTERGARKPHELAAGTAALRSAGLRPASSGGFQPPVLLVPSRCAPARGGILPRPPERRPPARTRQRPIKARSETGAPLRLIPLVAVSSATRAWKMH